MFVQPKRQGIAYFLLSSLFATVALAFFLLNLTPVEAASKRIGERGFPDINPPTKRTHLYEIQLQIVELEEFPDTGGGIEPLAEHLLVVTPRGRIALVHTDGEVDYLPHRVPMFEVAPDRPIT